MAHPPNFHPISQPLGKSPHSDPARTTSNILSSGSSATVEMFSVRTMPGFSRDALGVGRSRTVKGELNGSWTTVNSVSHIGFHWNLCPTRIYQIYSDMPNNHDGKKKWFVTRVCKRRNYHELRFSYHSSLQWIAEVATPMAKELKATITRMMNMMRLMPQSAEFQGPTCKTMQNSSRQFYGQLIPRPNRCI